MSDGTYSRKEFISFLGKASLGALLVPPFLMSCGNTSNPANLASLTKERLDQLKKLLLEALPASDMDDLLLANGLDYHVILRWGDKISDRDTFGFNNDFTCFLPLNEKDPTDGLLWVNHEYVNPLFVSGFDPSDSTATRTKEQIDKEMYEVGGSIVRIRQENGK